MKLGTRWPAFTAPPTAVPDVLHGQIAAVERLLPNDQVAHQPTPYWTLTWLEGRPVAELDTGVIVSLDAQGQAVVRHDVDDEFAG
jgi:hypothetical protein